MSSYSKADIEKTALRRRIQDFLREEDSRSLFGSLGAFLSGLGVCVGAGIVIATAISLFLYFSLDKTYLGWWGWFLAYWVVLVPILIWQEKRSHNDYLVESLGNVEDDVSGHADHGAIHSRGGLAVVTDAIAWGPKNLIDGAAGLRGKWTARQNKIFKRAAQLVGVLAKYDGGIEVRTLIQRGEDMAIFTAAMDWLERNEWAGKSPNGERVWISSPGRKKLIERDMVPHQKVKVVM